MTLDEQVAALKTEVASLTVLNQTFLQRQKESDQIHQTFLTRQKESDHIHQKLREKVDQQSQRLAEVEHQNEWFKRQLFGRKSERRLAEVTKHQLCLDEVMDVEEAPPPTSETIQSYQRRQRRKLPMEGSVLEKGLRFDETVPVEEVEIPNPAIEGLDPSQYTIVSEKVTVRLAQRPGSYVIVRYIRKVAKLKATKKLTCAPAPSSVLEKSYADVSFLAGLVIDKFRSHLPLYRQHQRLLDSGVQLSRGTLTNLVHHTIDLLEPIYYAMLSSILQSKVLTMDETPIKAGRDKKKHKMKTGYFWPIYGDQEEVAFIFANTRGSPVVKETLGAFCGTLVSDGYKVYEKYAAQIDTVTHAQCWAHTRRKFSEAEKVEPTLSSYALDLIGQLYAHETTIREESFDVEAALALRYEQSQPWVDTFFQWLKEVFQEKILLPSSPFTKAAHYALEREKALRVFLQDPKVPIDTNHIERQIRPVAVGRKNWLFCWTEVGARYVGIAHSLIASCRLHNVHPYTYLVDVLQRIQTHPARDVHQLTPRLWAKHFADNPLRSDIDRQK